MKTILVLLSAVCLATGVTSAQNLLLNGDFNSPSSVAAPDNWSTWSYGGGYANHEMISPVASVMGNYDGSYQMTIGAANTSGGGGVFQTVLATAGMNYSLSVAAGAQNWWLPTGEIRLFFLDAANAQLGQTVLYTTDSIHNPDTYDVGVAYQLWSLSAVAPVGTTQAKVELAGFGGGSAWFDNAILTVPEPGTVRAGCLRFGIVARAPLSVPPKRSARLIAGLSLVAARFDQGAGSGCVVLVSG